MASLKDSVISRTLQHVEVVRLSRDIAKWWNTHRKPDDTLTFCGWYWIRGTEEDGPFPTRSAALRDAYYRFVLRREMPDVGQSALHGVGKKRR